MPAVTQEWVHNLPMMQQTVLLTAVRGPDGVPKYGCTKMLLRWYRRCFLLSALDRKVLTDPINDNGGSFTGPSIEQCDFWEWAMDDIVVKYLQSVDAIPHHFQMHLMHGIEILGYKHPDERIRKWWLSVYLRLVKALHLQPESEANLDDRLGDSRVGWLRHADKATIH